MPLPVILAVCTAGILCLTPLTLYLFWLAHVNRRDRPTVCGGVGDFVALLAGLSGFLFSATLLVPTLLTTLAFGGRRATFDQLGRSWDRPHDVWLAGFGGTILVIALLAWRGVAARRRSFAVYNVEPDVAASAVDAAARVGTPPNHQYTGGKPGDMFEIVLFHVFSHARVRFSKMTDDGFRAAEQHLRKTLAAAPGADNAAGPWIGTAAVSGFVAVIGCVILIAVGTFAGR